VTRRILLLGLVVAAAGYMPRPAAAAPPPLSDADAAKVLAAVRPGPGEDAFAEIPWRTSLWEARQVAAKEGKPILLWEMDGHPLGCG
jgi:hypothetical protein